MQIVGLSVRGATGMLASVGSLMQLASARPTQPAGLPGDPLAKRAESL